jgi:hypothetical protein
LFNRYCFLHIFLFSINASRGVARNFRPGSNPNHGYDPYGQGYPFQQLFTAVAELYGLKDKIAATGYELSDIAMVDDDFDDDSDDEGEKA